MQAMLAQGKKTPEIAKFMGVSHGYVFRLQRQIAARFVNNSSHIKAYSSQPATVNHSSQRVAPSSLPQPGTPLAPNSLTPTPDPNNLVIHPSPRKGESERETYQSFEGAFSKLWKLYPRKVGRQAAYRKYVARRREGIAHEDLQRAVEQYAAEAKGREADYVKHCATFFGPDEHWKEALSRWQPPGLTSEEKRSKANAAIARAIAKKQASQLGEPSSAGG